MPDPLTAMVSEGADSAVARLASVPGVSTASTMIHGGAGTSAVANLLPVLPELAGLLPFGGLRRGSTVSVVGSNSLLLGLLAESTARGSWAAVIGMPDLGMVAAAELGVATDRVAVVAEPGTALVPVVATLLDGVDMVVVGTRVTGRTARQLSARARHRGAVLLATGPWPGADVELRCDRGSWRGLDGSGHGYLADREVTVRARGRGAAARPVAARLLLPGPGGEAESAALGAVEPVAAGTRRQLERAS